MEKNNRYYWIKLKTDFFNQETIDFLLSQKNGCEYIVLYQMLCLQTANNNGIMATKIGEILIPYDINKIVRDTKYFDIDTVTVALSLFKKLGLIYEESNEILKITNIDDMVGSESSSAKRVREYRDRKKMLQCNTNVTQDIEYRYKSIDIDIYKEKINKKEIQNEFEEIWKYYPKKIGKSKSLEYYIKARKDGTTKEQILNGVINYAESVKNTNPKYIKHGSTWFYGKYWKDEIQQKESKEERLKRLEEEIREEEKNNAIKRS